MANLGDSTESSTGLSAPQDASPAPQTPVDIPDEDIDGPGVLVSPFERSDPIIELKYLGR